MLSLPAGNFGHLKHFKIYFRFSTSHINLFCFVSHTLGEEDPPPSPEKVFEKAVGHSSPESAFLTYQSVKWILQECLGENRKKQNFKYMLCMAIYELRGKKPKHAYFSGHKEVHFQKLSLFFI